MTQTTPPNPVEFKGGTRRGSRLRRWAIRGVVGLAMGIGGYYLLTQSFVTRWIVTSSLSSLSGGEVTADAVAITLGGEIDLQGGMLRAPGVSGPGGTIFEVRRLRAKTDPWALLRGSVVLEDVEVESPLLRISQSVDDSTVNMARLTPRAGGGGGSAAPTRIGALPRVTVRGGVIELGEHRASGEFTSLRRVEVVGDVEREADEEGAAVLSLRQAENGVAMEGGLEVLGRVSPKALTLELGRLSLSSLPPEQVPTPLREAFRQMQLEGEATGVEFEYSFEGRGVTARIPLAGLAVTLPLEPQPGETKDERKIPLSEEDAKRRMRMEGVSGEIEITAAGLRGELAGTCEGVPYTLKVEWGGWNQGAPFDATITTTAFKLEQQPDILWFAPGVVRLRLAQFDNPTGIVDATVRIFRERPGADLVAMPLQMSGDVRIREGVAAFDRFPYQFRNIDAHITFDQTRIDFRSLTGVAPSGATISATGFIAPPNEFPEVRILVESSNMPTDEKLQVAMRAKGRFFEELFSYDALAALRSAGVLAPSAMEATAAMPHIELGGRASVTALVTRTLGEGQKWGDEITIHFPEMTLLPRAVPYPLLGKDVTIVSRDDLATIETGTFKGLTGADIAITASVDLAAISDPDTAFVPEITVRATDLPADALLIGAIRGIGGATGPQATRNVADDLQEYNLAGTMSLSARVFADARFEDSLAYEVTARPTRLSSRPLSPQGAARVVASDVSGTVTVTNEAVVADFSGTVAHPDGSGSSVVRGELTRALMDGHEPEFEAVFRSPHLDPSLVMEDLVRVPAAAAADEVASLRERYEPRGRLALDLSLSGLEPTNLSASLNSMVGLSVRIGDGRGSIDAPVGAIVFGKEDGQLRLNFQGLEGTIASEGSESGRVRLDGTVDLPGTSEAPERGDARPLAISMVGGRFDCSLLHATLRASGAERVAMILEKIDARGFFDADVVVSNDGRASGTIRPTAIGLNLAGSVLDAVRASGVISFERDQGRFQDLVLEDARGLVLRASGGWQEVAGDAAKASTDAQAAPSVTMQADLELDDSTLSPALVAALPLAAQGVLSDLTVKVDGPVSMRDGTLSLVVGPEGDVGSFQFSGRVGVSRASMIAGVEANDASGTIELGIERQSAGQSPAFELWALIDSVRVAGVSATSARVRVAGSGDGRVLVPLLSAAVHGGRVSATVTLSEPNFQARRTFEVLLQASEIRFASLLDELRETPGAAVVTAAAETGVARDPRDMRDAHDMHDMRDVRATVAAAEAAAAGEAGAGSGEAPDGSRGLLGASFGMTGVQGDALSRRGRGRLTIGGGGRILDLPLLVPLVRATNLQFPVEEQLDHATAEFFILGNVMSFDELTAMSPSVSVHGFGEATWPEMDLNLRFRTRARSQIPLISGVLDTLRNEFFSTRLRGPVRDPVVTMQSFGGTTRLFDRMLSVEESEDERRLNLMEGRGRRPASTSPLRMPGIEDDSVPDDVPIDPAQTPGGVR